MLHDYAKTFNCGSQQSMKIVREMAIPHHITCLLKNVYVGQEAIFKTDHERRDWIKNRKEMNQGSLLSPCLFHLHAVYITQMLSCRNHKLKSRFPVEISITSDMQMTPLLWQKLKRN